VRLWDYRHTSLAEGVTYKGEKTVPLEAGYPWVKYKMTMENYKS
jgi:hypothetical protein